MQTVNGEKNIKKVILLYLLQNAADYDLWITSLIPHL